MTVLDTTSAPAAAPAAVADHADPGAPEQRCLRALRASLVDEVARVRRWQRLVRARLDLATDRLSPAEALRGLLPDHPVVPVGGPPGPGGMVVAHPATSAGPAGPADLVALVRGQVGDVAVDPADDLRAVLLTHRALREHGLGLEDRLARVDRALAARGPGCCPGG